jgi:hypothetical protein
MAHASQIADDSFFLTMPPEAFAAAFGTEWYIQPGTVRQPGGAFVTDLLAGLSPAPSAGGQGASRSR